MQEKRQGRLTANLKAGKLVSEVVRGRDVSKGGQNGGWQVVSEIAGNKIAMEMCIGFPVPDSGPTPRIMML